MSFTVDYATERGKVRQLVGDVKSGTSVFSDEQIDAFLEDNSDSVLLAAADGARARAALLINTSFDLELTGALRLDREKIAENWMKLASEYQRRATFGPDVVVEYMDSFDVDIDVLGDDKGEYVGDLV